MEYLSCAETAKLVRKALKQSFPGVKFSVRSHVYSGGASIRVGWTDGPTTEMVDWIVKPFAGATFDGMVDLKSYVTGELNGQPVHFGADYVFTERKVSSALLTRAIAQAVEEYGPTNLPPDAASAYTAGNLIYVSPMQDGASHYWSWQQILNRTLSELPA